MVPDDCHCSKSEACNLVRQDRFTFTYVVVSECSQNRFIFDKCKTVQSFKLHFLQNIFLCDCTRLPATVKVLETFLEAVL